MFSDNRERQGFCSKTNGNYGVRISLEVDEGDGGHNCKKGVTPLLLELSLVGSAPPLPGICFNLAGKVWAKVLLPLYHPYDFISRREHFEKEHDQACQPE